ncbi:MAG: tetratricopeptide repeat protein [Bacteroidota bacterium]
MSGKKNKVEFSKKTLWWISLAVFGIAFILYANTLGHDYILDDAIVITKNERVQEGVSGIPDLFNRYRSNQLIDQYGFRPIVLTTFAIEYELFGLNPMAGHFANVFLFGLLSVLVFWVQIMLFGKKHLWAILAVTSLFVFHPIHTEVVANIKSRDEILALTFGLLALYQGLKFLKSLVIWRLLGSISFFILAVLSKEHAVIFAVVIPLAALLFSKKQKVLYLLLLVIPYAIISSLVLPYPTMLKVAFFSLILLSFFVFLIITYGNSQLKITSVQLNLKQILSYSKSTFTDVFDLATERYLNLSILVAVLIGLGGLLCNNKIFIGLSFLLLLIIFVKVKKEKELIILTLSLFTCVTALALSVPEILLTAVFLSGFYIFKSKKKFPAILVIAYMLPICGIYYLTAALPVLFTPFIFLFIIYLSTKEKLRFAAIILMGVGAYFIFNIQYIDGLLSAVFVLLIFIAFGFFPKRIWISIFVSALFLTHLNFPLSNSSIQFSNIFSGNETSENTETSDLFDPIAYQDEIGLRGLVHEDRVLGNSMIHIHDWGQKIPNALNVLTLYLKKFIYPEPLIYYHGYNQIPLIDWKHPNVWIGLFSYLGFMLIGVFRLKKNPILAFGCLFYLVAIVPFSHFFLPLPDTMADRFFFTPSLALSMVVVFGSLSIIQSLKPQYLLIGLAPIMLFFAAKTHKRNLAWKDNKTLFSTDISKLENSSRANYHYANSLALTFTPNPNGDNRAEIIKHYERAIEIFDKSYNARLDLGLMYIKLNQPAKAEVLYKELVTLFPDEGRPYFYLGNCNYTQQKYDEAIVNFNKSISLAPNREDVYFYLAWAHYMKGDPQEAINIVTEKIVSAPSVISYRLALSDFYFGSGDPEKGHLVLIQALEVKPDDLSIYDKILTRYTEEGNQEKVQFYLNEAKRKGLVN